MNEAIRAWNDLEAILLSERSGRAETMLWEWFGLSIESPSLFSSILGTLSDGYGFGDDSGGISLPAGVLVESLEANAVTLEFCVEIQRTDYGNPSDEFARMSVPAFLFYCSTATVVHAKYADAKLDAFEVIGRIHEACSPARQFSLVREQDRVASNLQLNDWM